MNIIVLIVGSVFLIIGIVTILSYSRFKKIGIKVKGRVKAIEKYESKSTSNDHTVSVLYRPIVEYIYKNETKTMVGGIGSNEIRHKLNQQLTIFIIESDDGGISTHIKDGMNYILGMVFSLIGVIAIAVYLFFIDGSILIASIVIPITFAIGIALFKLAKNTKGLVVKDNVSTRNSILIETKSDYLKEITTHRLWGNIAAYGFMFASLGVIYAGYYQLPSDAQSLITNDLSGFFDIVTSDLPSSWEKPLIITSFGVLFFLASIHSALYIKRKYGGSMSRI